MGDCRVDVYLRLKDTESGCLIVYFVGSFLGFIAGVFQTLIVLFCLFYGTEIPLMKSKPFIRINMLKKHKLFPRNKYT